ncbi:MAG: helix-turn-helix domain-containing protein [Rhabdochlamydiaceae bacterium]
MARTNQISKGAQFLQGTSLTSLSKLYKKENNGKAKLRLLACIKRKQGHTFPEISESMNIAPSTLSDWLTRIQKNGLDGRKDQKRDGRPCWLNPEQIAQLKAELMQNPQSFGFAQSMWSTKMVMEHIRKRYGYSYAARSMYDLLHKIGFTIKKPRQTHYKSATESEKKRFKKKQEE